MQASDNKWAFFRAQHIDLDGGEMIPYWMGNPAPKAGHCYTYLNNLTLSNGGRVESDVAVWAGNQPSSESGEWNVRGTSPSRFDSPVMFLDTGSYNEFIVRVSDVTGGEEADFTMSKAISAFAGYMNVDIAKQGQGTMELTGTIGLSATNCVNVYAGVVKLGASGVTDAGAQRFKLCGGALESGDFTTNSVGLLKIEARGDHTNRIVLGENSLMQFPDCTGVAWSGAEGSVCCVKRT